MSSEQFLMRGLMEQDQLPLGAETVFCEEACGPANMLSQPLRDRYRCPENFFDFVLAGELSSDKGYFQFGESTTCYGRSCSGTSEYQPKPSLHDALRETVIEEAKVRLPFDPSEIIDNLRLERYTHSRLSGYDNVLKKIYYRIRPLTNQFLRKRIQRFHARTWPKLPFPRWPVDTTVENICETLLLLSLEAKGVDCVPFVWFWPRGARGCRVHNC
jgi:hypothetical protein